jgi:phosphoribosylformylglycinamidine cyclo-ligase
VDRAKVLTGERVAPGDVILGLASSGVHSNGFSLVRRIVADCGWDLASDGLGESLLEPTRIYVRSLLPLVQEGRIHGLAHITGGGLLENIPRVLTDRCHALVDTDTWPQPPIFAQLQEGGSIAPGEMARTFNCGIGMAVIVAADEADGVAEAVERSGEIVHRIGRVEEGPRGCTVRGSAGRWGSGEDWSATHQHG